MTFPSNLPTAGTPRVEDGRLFESRDGRWESRPQVFELFHQDTNKDESIPFPDPGRRAKSMIRVKATGKVNSANSHLQFNMLNSNGRWTKQDNQFENVNGTLESGPGRWRGNQWHQTSNALLLTWNGDWWKCKQSTVFEITIVLQKLGSSGKTQFAFSVDGNESNSNNVFRTYGAGTINNAISDFIKVGISMDVAPAFFHSHVEIY